MGRRSVLLSVFVLVIVGAAVSVAFAGLPAIGGGVAHTCAHKGNEELRVADAAKGCKKDETPVDLYTKEGADAAFLTQGGKAADSDKLDGLDSTDYQRRVTGSCGSGQAITEVKESGAVTCGAPALPLFRKLVQIAAGATTTLADNGFAQVIGTCGTSGAAKTAIVSIKAVGEKVNLVADSRTITGVGQTIDAGNSTNIAVTNAIDRGDFNLAGTSSGGTLAGSFYAVGLPSACQFQLTAIG